VIEFTESNKNLAVVEPLNHCTFKLFLIKKNQILFSEKYSWSEIESMRETITSKILSTFKTAEVNSTKKVSRDEIDAAQIIYSYLKGSNSSYIVISEQLLDTKNTAELDDELNRLMQSYTIN
jgi:excinuclease ABC subunit C